MTFVAAASGYDCLRSGWSADAAKEKENGLESMSDSAIGAKDGNRWSADVPAHEMASVNAICGGHVPGPGPYLCLAGRGTGTLTRILTSTASRLQGPVRSLLPAIRNRETAHHTSASQQ